jgi:hypothetical protein
MMIKLIVEYVMPSICLLVSRFTICPLLLVSAFMYPDHNSSSSTPSDDELGTQSRCATDYTCENTSCHRAFHSLCLRDWLRSITTTRQYVEMGFLKMVLSPKTAESLRNITDSKDGARQSHGA